MEAESSGRIIQPNSRHCFVCGLENRHGLGLRFYELDATHVMAEFIPPPQFEGYPGLLHGGIAAAMLDEAVERAAMIGRHGHFMMTAKLDIRYRKPVPLGQTLTLLGEITRLRGRLASAAAEIRLEDGSLAVEAEGLLADLPELPARRDLEQLGWKVYPEEEGRRNEPA